LDLDLHLFIIDAFDIYYTARKSVSYIRDLYVARMELIQRGLNWRILSSRIIGRLFTLCDWYTITW